MKVPRITLIAALFLAPLLLRAQSNPPAEAAPPEAAGARKSQSEVAPPPLPGVAVIRTGGRIGEGPGPVMYQPLEPGPGLGAWWKNSEIVSKLQLTDQQVRKISETFLDHRLKLIDLQADLDKQELRLQPLLDVDNPEATKVGAQIDLITTARGRLEKENAMMMLDIRRWLSVDQWKKLKSLEPPGPGSHNVFYYRTNHLPGGPGLNFEGPPPLPLPDDTPGMPRPKPLPDDMPVR